MAHAPVILIVSKDLGKDYFLIFRPLFQATDVLLISMLQTEDEIFEISVFYLQEIAEIIVLEKDLEFRTLEMES